MYAVSVPSCSDLRKEAAQAMDETYILRAKSISQSFSVVIGVWLAMVEVLIGCSGGQSEEPRVLEHVENLLSSSSLPGHMQRPTYACSMQARISWASEYCI